MTSEAPDFKVTLPPHARITALAFEGAALHLSIEGGADQRLDAAAVQALFGARVRHEEWTEHLPADAFNPVMNDATEQLDPMEIVHSERLPYVLGMRLRNSTDAFYLAAESFNFRHALGDEAGYAQDPNFRALVRKLAATCPDAPRDAFVDAVVGGRPLPAPVGTLRDFLWTVHRA